jgi:hypothetical protein
MHNSCKTTVIQVSVTVFLFLADSTMNNCFCVHIACSSLPWCIIQQSWGHSWCVGHSNLRLLWKVNRVGNACRPRTSRNRGLYCSLNVAQHNNKCVDDDIEVHDCTDLNDFLTQVLDLQNVKKTNVCEREVGGRFS